MRAFAPIAGVLAISVCIATPSFASANLLTNGDFEATGTGNIPDADMPGWNATPENHTHIANSASSDGNYAVLNHNGKNFAIFQKFKVTAGTTYELNFDFGVAKKTTFNQNAVLLLIGPKSGPIFGGLNSTDGPNKGQLWQTFTYDFTADTTEKFAIEFASIGSTDNTADTAFIDNVSIRAVPEASTLLLFGALIAGGLMLLRRRTLNTA